ncbi:mesoderm posterior protein 2-like [Xyrauchen texanus]|uniref:mesoderm posterior protein 2-like n=1 Tax=Xyrauchen texanus TaxID=154827 RepID=UPI0022426176|nr:mesoderm posterior protein 2-like [Xyrauchen texanus]
MDITSSSLQFQDSRSFLFDCENLLDQNYTVSDAGYFSAGSSLSPTSSIDSCGFSPPAHSYRVGQDIPQILPHNSNTTQLKRKDEPPKRTGRPMSKFPGVKRQTASDREKLRMRDLTKALQHLRMYLPPSVAPAGKTLTKIEILRLTIQYITCLSAQLELSEEEANQGIPSEQIQIVTSSIMFDNFNEVPTLTQSLPAQHMQPMTYYQNPFEDDFLSFSAQDFWSGQKQC